jgi:hypothetical protein
MRPFLQTSTYSTYTTRREACDVTQGCPSKSQQASPTSEQVPASGEPTAVELFASADQRSVAERTRYIPAQKTCSDCSSDDRLQFWRWAQHSGWDCKSIARQAQLGSLWIPDFENRFTNQNKPRPGNFSIPHYICRRFVPICTVVAAPIATKLVPRQNLFGKKTDTGMWSPLLCFTRFAPLPLPK